MTIIQLGAPSDLRPYIVADKPSLQLVREQANPMSTRINTSGEFDEEDAWDAWVMDNWQAGTGRKDAQSGGTFYSEVETRFSRKMFLSPQLDYSSFKLGGVNRIPGSSGGGPDVTPSINNSLTVGTGGDVEKFGISHNVGGNSETGLGVWLFLYSGTDELTIEMWQDHPSSGTLKDTQTLTPDVGNPGAYWFYVDIDDYVFTAIDRPHYIVLYPTTASSVTLPVKDDASPQFSNISYSGSSWSNNSNHVFFLVDVKEFRLHADTTTLSAIPIRYFPASAETYLSMESHVRKWDGAAAITWANVNTATSDATSIEVFLNELWVASGGSNAVVTFNSSDSKTTESFNADLLRQDGLYIWRSIANDLYYSSDGSTWTGPIEVGPDDFSIRGMISAGGDFFCITDEALWIIAPNDIPVGIERLDSIDSENGKYLTSVDGALYFNASNRVMRYDPSGTLQDIWLTVDDGLPSRRIGPIKGITNIFGQVVVLVQSSDNVSTAWAWNGQGWHHYATLPFAMPVIWEPYWDRANNRFFMFTENGYAVDLITPQHGPSPLQDSSSRYTPSGWVEWDKFWGGSRLLSKDWESVTIWGQDLDSNVNVEVYWQDQDSEDWELLGVAVRDGQEFRWSDYNTRPNSQWLKLGLLLKTNDNSTTPIVEAVVVKFLPMVNDRYRWNVSIPIGDRQQMPDGSINTQTAAEMSAHLDSMISRVPPFIFQDVDGTQYEVKVVSHRKVISEYEYVAGANKAKYVYQLVLEMVDDQTYAG